VGGLVGAIGVDGVKEMPEMRGFLGGSRFVEFLHAANISN
jgi:hypothetical protein